MFINISMLYTDKWAFIHIPKTSGVNLKINAIEKIKDAKMPYSYYDKNRIEAEIIEHNPYWYWQEKILKNQQAFTIVRNPYFRAFSLWFYTTRKYKMFHKKHQSPNSFIDFLNKPQVFKSAYWNYKTNQVDFIKSNNNQKCKVYKYESDLNDLENYLGFKFTNTNHNTIDKITTEKINIDEFYNNSERVEFVNNTYKNDFIAFGYEMRK